jgi:hypothetical protein
MYDEHKLKTESSSKWNQDHNYEKSDGEKEQSDTAVASGHWRAHRDHLVIVNNRCAVGPEYEEACSRELFLIAGQEKGENKWILSETFDQHKFTNQVEN